MFADDALSMETDERLIPSSKKDGDESLAAEVARHLMAKGFADKMLRAFETSAASLVREDPALPPNHSPQAATGASSGYSVRTEVGEASRVTSSSTAWHLIEPFDPDNEEASIQRWITRLDMLGEMHGWSEKEKVLASQARLDGAAKKWFYRLDRINYEWEEWCSVLKGAFLLRNTFGAMIEELALRRKRSNETMTEYHRDKMALCARVDITGEHAVSCIVHGLPEPYKANAHAAKCATPEALYNDFLLGLEEPVPSPSNSVLASQRVPNANRPPKRHQTPQAVVKGLHRCYNCQQMTTHFSKDCPLERKERCRRCGAHGHIWTMCPKMAEETGDYVKEGRLLHGRREWRGGRGRKSGVRREGWSGNY